MVTIEAFSFKINNFFFDQYLTVRLGEYATHIWFCLFWYSLTNFLLLQRYVWAYTFELICHWSFTTWISVAICSALYVSCSCEVKITTAYSLVCFIQCVITFMMLLDLISKDQISSSNSLFSLELKLILSSIISALF